MGTYRFQDLIVWQKAIRLVEMSYGVANSLPPYERYALADQIRRTAVSIPSNIAEGSARESKRDYLHFLHIARDSLSEPQYFIHLAHRLGYLETAEAEIFIGKTKQTFACLHGLVQAVEKESGKFVNLVTAAASLFALALVSKSPFLVVM